MYYAFDRRWLQSTVNVTLVVLNVALYLVCLATGDLLYDAGELSVVRVAGYGEYNRLVSAMFLHSGIGHLFSNMILLFYIGATVERNLGHVTYALLYLVSGITGNAATIFYEVARHQSWSSVGASGAVFGVMGAMVVLLLRMRAEQRAGSTLLPRVAFMVAYSLFAGMRSGMTNNIAHVAGLLTGMGITYLLTLSGRRIDMRGLL